MQSFLNAHVTGLFSQRAEAGFDMMINQGVGGVFGRDYYGFGTATNYYSPTKNFSIDLLLSYTFTYGVPFELTETLYVSGVLDSRYCCGETEFSADFSHSVFLDTIDLPAGASVNSLSGVIHTVQVTKTNQTLTFGIAPTVLVGEIGYVSATGGGSGNLVTFSSNTPEVCDVNGSAVTGVNAGTCTITADQAGDANFNTATQVTQTIVIGTGEQNLSFGIAPTLAVGGTGTVSATGGASGNVVTFTTTTPTICTVAGSTVTAQVAGNCVIAANQTGTPGH